jgi:hypothetical protein
MSTDDPTTDSTDPAAPTLEGEAAEATVNRDAEGDPLGCMLFLGAEELEDLGVDDAGSVEYRVGPDGAVRVSEGGSPDV